MYNPYKPSSKRPKKVASKRVFCAVNVGVNECEICGEDAYYSKNISNRKHKSLPTMSLFGCGHGMCETCVTKMENISGYKCPFCRNEGSVILRNFGSNEIKGQLNTFDDFLQEWRDYLCRAMNSSHPFAILHKQIVSDYQKKRRVEKKKRALLKMRQEKKMSRTDSRKKAVCKICGRDKFTSEKQLKIHMAKKH